MILSVRKDDLQKIIGDRPFMALPQEEIDRHYASIELHPMESTDAAKDDSVVPLLALVAVHHNYSWLTYTSKPENNSNGHSVIRSLCLTGHILYDGHNDIFLDERIKPAVTRIVTEKLSVQSGYDLRLAGLLRSASIPSGLEYPGIVFIARLRQQGAHAKHNDFDICSLGSGELQENRQLFDNCSRVLIDHITAL